MIANSTLLSFMGCAFGLTLILSFVAILPWLRRSSPRLDLLHLNVAVFRERLIELETDFANNKLEGDDYIGQKIDLERQLLAAQGGDVACVERSERRVPKIIVGLVFLWIPLLAFTGYFYVVGQKTSGHRALLDFWSVQDRYAQIADDLLTEKLKQPPIDMSAHGFELLQAMQINAYQHPFDTKRWLNLSQYYLAANDPDSALASLAHAYRLKPEDNHVAMMYAQMRFLGEQGKIDPVTQKIVAQILVQNPNHEGALLLMSMMMYRNQQYDVAIDGLQRLKQLRLSRATTQKLVDPKMIAELDQTIRDAEQARDQWVATTTLKKSAETTK